MKTYWFINERRCNVKEHHDIGINRRAFI